mgnify:CR=1 FL=1
MNLHHVGIFIESQKKGLDFFNKIIKINKKSKIIVDKKLGVKVRFLYDNKNNCYELVSPYSIKNPVKKVLKERKNIINHFAYKTKKFQETILYLRKINCAPLTRPQPSVAFNKKKIIFFLTPLNFIIELIED